jgi:hypothetical protein
MQFTKHTYAAKPTRYYVDGKRVTRAAYDEAQRGRDLNSFITKCLTPRGDNAGRFVHYCNG